MVNNHHEAEGNSLPRSQSYSHKVVQSVNKIVWSSSPNTQNSQSLMEGGVLSGSQNGSIFERYVPVASGTGTKQITRPVIKVITRTKPKQETSYVITLASVTHNSNTAIPVAQNGGMKQPAMHTSTIVVPNAQLSRVETPALHPSSEGPNPLGHSVGPNGGIQFVSLETLTKKPESLQNTLGSYSTLRVRDNSSNNRILTGTLTNGYGMNHHPIESSRKFTVLSEVSATGHLSSASYLEDPQVLDGSAVTQASQCQRNNSAAPSSLNDCDKNR